MVEFDSPSVLLDNTQSYFSSLVEQTGAAEAEYLRRWANSHKSHAKDKRQLHESDDEIPLETNELDPLVPSNRPM